MDPERNGSGGVIERAAFIDSVVGGHSHANLTEPIYVNDLDGKPVMIVQGYRWGVYVGQIDLKK